MLAEMIKAIVGLADERMSFKTHLSPDGRTQIVTYPSGETVELAVPNDREYSPVDLAGFIALLGKVQVHAKSPIVFVNGTHFKGVDAVCFFSEEERRDRMLLHVPYSNAFKQLVKLTNWHKQRDVVFALRDQLFSSAESGLLAKLRSIDFSRKNDGTRTVEHGRESLGRSIENAVQSKNGEIPERTSFHIPMFSTGDFNMFAKNIECTVDLDASNETIRFVPQNDQLEEAIEHGLQFVARTIQEAITDDEIDAMVLLGSPS